MNSFVDDFRAGFAGVDSPEADWRTNDDQLLGPFTRVEEFIAIGFLILMVISVLAGIVWRFFFTPLTWTLSGAMVGFVWPMSVGASVPNAHDDHIQFDPLYNRMSPNAQRWSRIVGNGLIVATFAWALPAMIKFALSVDNLPVVGLPVDLRAVYASAVWFFASTILYRGRLFVTDIKRSPKRTALRV